MWKTLNTTSDQVVLKRATHSEIPIFSELLNSSTLRVGLLVDVETTGRDFERDQIVEIGIRQFRFDYQQGKVVELLGSFNGLQEPSTEMSPESRFVTGLTPEALRGRSIDWQEVNRLFSESDLIIAHNALFDRAFIDGPVEASRRKVWACSLKQVDWLKRGFGAANLALIAAHSGYFSDAHRALTDADTTLLVLAQEDPALGTPLKELVEQTKRKHFRVYAQGAGIEFKGDLRRRAYQWDPDARVWSKQVTEVDLSPEVKWLEETVYKFVDPRSFHSSPIWKEIPAFEMFRTWQKPRETRP